MTPNRRKEAIPNPYVQAIRRAVQELLKRAEITSAPVDVGRLARYQGVVRITEAALGATDAQLSPTDQGFVIEVNSYVSPQRQRFSIAHEIAHTFFNPATRSYRRPSEVVTIARERPESLIEEELCDIAAGEILLPEHLFMELAHRDEPSIPVLRRLAAHFDASLEATALRYAALTHTPVQVTIWRRRYSRLLPKWSRGPKVWPATSFEMRRPDSFVTWSIAKAYLTNDFVSEDATETALYPARRIWLQAQGFRHGSGRYVLSLMRSAYSSVGSVMSRKERP